MMKVSDEDLRRILRSCDEDCLRIMNAVAELLALRKVANVAQEASYYCDCCCARCIALEDALREAGR